MRVQFIAVSQNAKTGPIPASIIERASCWPGCAFYENGCYAEAGALALHWDRVSRGLAGGPWSEFCAKIAALRSGRLWRYAEAGDLPGHGAEINGALLGELVAANIGKNAIAFTHKPVLGDDPVAVENRRLIAAAVTAGLTVNLSANNPAHADRLAELGIAPVVTVLARAYARKALRHRFKRRRDEWAETISEWRDRTASLRRHTPAGRWIAICPATYSDATCKTCGACAHVRDAVIGFPAHGAWRQVEAGWPPGMSPLEKAGHSRNIGRWLRSSPRRQQQPDTFALPICGPVGPRRRSIPLREGVHPVSLKPEVIADTSNKWCGNALRFATREEAEANVRDLMMRWFAVRETRIVESDDPVNYRYINGRLERLTSEATMPMQ